MEEHLITDIQHFSLHDGPGIRTTVFFKGCPLSCRWCHNPEAISFSRELMYYAPLCTGCGRCIPVCPEGCFSGRGGDFTPDRGRCTLCGACAEACREGALEIKGRALTVDEIAAECLIDRPFYKGEGGVTLSGGEALMQEDFLISLLRRLKQEKLHIVLDSCGQSERAALSATVPYVDLYYYDVKCMTSSLHREWTGAGNEMILENLGYLLECGASVIVRTPVIGGFNDTPGEMNMMAGFLSPWADSVKVHFLPYHNLGSAKNTALGQSFTPLRTPSMSELEALAAPLRTKGIQTEIFSTEKTSEVTGNE